jgi:uncharacterized protein
MSAVLLVAAGVVVGVLSALFGVGGGLLMVPFIVLTLDRGQHLAEGTSLLAMVPIALVGALFHARRGYVSFRYAAYMAAGGIAGAYLGADLALRVDSQALTKVFGVFLVLMGARTVWDGLRTSSKDDHSPNPGAPA